MTAPDLVGGLEACLAALEQGASIEEALAPHGAAASELRPLVEEAARLRAHAPLTPVGRDRLRTALVAEAATRYAPPHAPNGRGASWGAERWLAVALLAAALGAGTLVLRARGANGPAAAVPTGAPRAAATVARMGGATHGPSKAGAPSGHATESARAVAERVSAETPFPATSTPASSLDVPSPMASGSGETAHASGEAALVGLVRQREGPPLSDAVVSVEAVGGDVRQFTKTLADGSYRLALPAGRYLVSARAPGHDTLWHPGVRAREEAQMVDLPAGSDVRVDFLLGLLDEPNPVPEPTEVPPYPGPPGYPGPPPPPPTWAPPYP